MFGDPSSPAGTVALKRRAKLTEEALARFKELWDVVFPAQVARKGADPARLCYEAISVVPLSLWIAVKVDRLPGGSSFQACLDAAVPETEAALAELDARRPGMVTVASIYLGTRRVPMPARRNKN